MNASVEHEEKNNTGFRQFFSSLFYHKLEYWFYDT